MRQPKKSTRQQDAEKYKLLSLTSLSTSLAFLLSACGGGSVQTSGTADADVADGSDDPLPNNVAQMISASDAGRVTVSEQGVDLGDNTTVVVNWQSLNLATDAEFSISASADGVLLMNVEGRNASVFNGKLSAHGVDALVLVNKNGFVFGESLDLSATGDTKILFSTVEVKQSTYNELDHVVNLSQPLLGLTVSDTPSTGALTLKGLSEAQAGSKDFILLTDRGQIDLGETGLVAANSIKITSNLGDVRLGEMVIVDELNISTDGLVSQYNDNGLESKSTKSSGSDISVGGQFVLDVAGAAIDGIVTAQTMELNSEAGVHSFNNDVIVHTLTTRANPYDLLFNENLMVTANVDFIHTGKLSLGNDSNDFSIFAAGVATAGNATAPSQVSVAGTVKTINSEINFSDITMIADSVFDAGDSDDSTIKVGAIKSGGYSLILDSGSTAPITVSSFDGEGNLLVRESANVVFEDQVTAAEVELMAVEGDVVFKANVNAVTITTSGQQLNLQFDDHVSLTGSATFSHGGQLRLGNDAEDIALFAGGLTAVGNETNPSRINIYGELNTLESKIDLGDVHLMSDVSLDTRSVDLDNGGAISLGVVNSGQNNLTIQSAKGGDVVLHSFLGNGDLTIVDCDGAHIVDSVVASRVDIQNAVKPVVFSGDVNIFEFKTQSNAYDIAFEEDVTIQIKLNLRNSGTVQLGDEATDLIALNAGVEVVGDAVSGSSVQLAGKLSTTAAQVKLIDLKLLSDVEVVTGGSNSAAIEIGDISTQGYGLTLNAGQSQAATISIVSIDDLTRGLEVINAGGEINLGMLGAINPGNVTIHHSESGVKFNGDVNANTIQIIDTAQNKTITFMDGIDVNLNADLVTTAKPYHMDIKADEFVVAGITRFMHQGNLTLGNHDSDHLVFSLGLDMKDVLGEISLAGKIETTGARLDANTVNLLTDVVLSTGDSADGVIDIKQVNSNAQHLTLDVGGVLGSKITLTAMPDLGGGLTIGGVGSLAVIGEIGSSVAGDVTVEAAAGDVSFSADANIDHLSINQVSVGQTVSFSDGHVVDIDSLSLLGQAYNISVLSSNFSVNQEANFTHQGSLTLGNDVGDVFLFKQGVSTTGNVTNPSLVKLGARISTDSKPIAFGDLSLVSDTVLNSSNAAINLGQVNSQDGNQFFQLWLDAGSGGVISAGSFVGSGDLVIENSGGSSFAAQVIADTLTIKDTADEKNISFAGDLIVTNAFLVSQADQSDQFNLFITGANNNVLGKTVFYHTGDLIIGDAIDDVSIFRGGFVATAQRAIYLSGTIKMTQDDFSVDFSDTTRVVRDVSLVSEASGDISLGDVVIEDGVTFTIVTGASNNISLDQVSGVASGSGSSLNMDTAGEVVLSGIVGLDISEVTLKGHSITLKPNASITATNTVTVSNSGDFTTTDTANILAANGFVQMGGGLSRLSADITTTHQDISFANAIILENTVSFLTGSEIGDITLNAAIDGAFTLTLAAGKGDVNLGGVVGASAGIASLTIDANDIVIDDIGDVDTIGVIGSSVLTATDNGSDLGSIRFSGTTYKTSGDFTVDAGSSNAIQFIGGSATFTATADDALFKSRVDLNGNNVTINSTDGHVTFNQSIDGSADFTVNSGAGSVSLQGHIGSVTRVNNFTITGTGQLDLRNVIATAINVSATNIAVKGGTYTAESAGVVFSGDVDLNFSANVVVSAVNDIQFSASVDDSGQDSALTLSSSKGDVSLVKSVGATNSIAAFTVTGNDVSLNSLGDGNTVGVLGNVAILASDVDADSGSITLTGTTYKYGGNLSIDAGAASNVIQFTAAANFIASGGDTVFTGLVDLNGSDLTFNSNNGDLTFYHAVDGLADLTLDAGTGAIDFQAAVGASTKINILTVSDANQIDMKNVTANAINVTADNIDFNGSTYLSMDGGITFTGAVDLDLSAGEVAVTSSGLSHHHIQFSSSIDDNSDADTALKLTAGKGDISVGQTIGAQYSVSSLTVTANDISLGSLGDADTVGVAGEVSVTATTNGSDTSSITLAGAYYKSSGALTLTSSEIALTTAASFITSNDAITINTADLTLQDGANLDMTTAGGAIVVNDIDGHSHEDVSLSSTGGTTNTVSVGTIGLTVVDGINTVSITAAAGVSFHGGIRTSSASGNSVAITGAATLTENMTIDTSRNVSDGTGDITFSSSISGAKDMVIIAGAGDIQVGGAVSLAEMNITSAKDVTLSAITASLLQQAAGTGITILNGAITTSTSSGVSFTGANLQVKQAITANNSGVVSFDHSATTTILAAADIVADGAVTIAADSGVHTAGDVTTTNDSIGFTGATTLTGHVVLNTGTGAGNIDFYHSVDGGYNLTLTAGTGDVNLVGDLGSSTTLAQLTVTGNDLIINDIGDGDTVGVTAAVALTATDAGLDTGSIALSGTTYKTNGAVTVNSGAATNVIQFTGGDATLTSSGDHYSFSGAVDLNGNNVLVTSNGGDVVFNHKINGAANLVITAGIGSVDLADNVGESTSLSLFSVVSASAAEVARVDVTDDITVTATAITLDGSQYTTSDAASEDGGAGSDIKFTGVVTLSNDVAVSLSHADGVNDEIEFSSTVAGGTYSLTLTARFGDINIADTASGLTDFSIVSAAAAEIARVDVTDDIAVTATAITLDGSQYTTSDAASEDGGTGSDIKFTGVVTLSNDVAVSLTNADGDNDEIQFSSTVVGGNNSLTLNSGAAGTIVVGGAISSVVTLDITNSNGAEFQGAVTATTVDISDTEDNQLVEFKNDVTATTLTTTANTYNLEFDEDVSVTSDTTFAAIGNLTLGNASGDVATFTGGLNTLAVSGTVTLAGTVKTTNTDMDLGAITLAANTTIDSGTAATSTMSIGAISSAGNALTLDSGHDVSADLSILSFAGNGALTLTDSGGASFSGAVAAGAVTLTDTNGDVVFNGDVTATSMATAVSAYNLKFNENLTVNADTTFAAVTGTVDIGNADDDVATFTGGLNTLAVSGTVTTSGFIRTAGQQADLDAITLGSNTTLDTTNNGVAATGAALNVGVITGGNYNLTLNSGAAGTIVVGGAISSVVTLDITNSNGAEFQGAVTATTVDISDTEDNQLVEFKNDVTATTLTTTANTYNLEFDEDVSVTSDTTFAAIGNLTLGNASGDVATFTGGLNTLAVSGTVTTSGFIRTAGQQADLDAITLGSNTTLDTTNNGVAATGAALNVGVITGGNYNLTLNSGAAGTIVVGGAISSVVTLDITNSNGAEFQGAVTATTVDISDTEDNQLVEFKNDVTATTLTTTANTYNLEFDEDVSVTSDTTFAAIGNLTLGNASGDVATFTGGLNTLAVSGTVTLAGTVKTTNTDMDLGAITLAANTTIDSGTAATSTMSIGAISSAGNALTLDSGHDVSADLSILSFAGNGALTLTDSGGASFSGAVAAGAVTLTDTNGDVVFNGDVTATSMATAVSAYNLKFNENLTVNADTTFAAVTGTVDIGNADDDVATFTGGLNTLAVSGTVTTSGSIRTAGQQADLDAITLGSNTTLDTTNNGVAATGAALNVGVITGGNYNLTLNSGAAGTIVVGGAISSVVTLDITNSNGAEFQGAVTATTVDISDTEDNQLVEFKNDVTATTLTTTANTYNLEFDEDVSVTSDTTFAAIGNLTLGNASGDVATFTGGLNTLAVSGTVTTSGFIRTAGQQADLDAITLGSNTTLDTTNNGVAATGAALNVGVITGGNYNLTLNSGAAGTIVVGGAISSVVTLDITNSNGAEFQGAVTATTVDISDTEDNQLVEFKNDVTATTLTTTANTYNLEFDEDVSVTSDTTFAAIGNLTLGNASGDVATFTGGLDTSDISGTVTLAGTVQTTDTDMDLGAITLAADTTIDSGTAATSTMSIGAISSATHALTLDSGHDVSADLSILSFAGNGALTLTDSGGATFSGAVAAGTLTLTNTNGDVVFNGDVTATSMATAVSAYNLKFNENLTVNADTTFAAVTGAVDIGNAIDDVATFTGGLNTLAVSGTVTTSGSIRTAGQQADLGAITLGSNTTLDTTNNGDDAEGAALNVGVITGGNNNLTLNSGTAGDVTLSGAVEGSTGAIVIMANKTNVDAGIAMSGAGSVNMDAADISVAAGITTVGGTISFDGAVVNEANAAIVIGTGAGSGNISFGSTLEANDTVGSNDITLTAGTGDVTFSAAVTLHDNDLTIVSADLVVINGSFVTSGGDVSIAASGAISGSANLTMGDGSVLTVSTDGSAGITLGDITLGNSSGNNHIFGDTDTGNMTFGKFVQTGTENTGNFGDVKIYKEGNTSSIIVKASTDDSYDIEDLTDRTNYIINDTEVESITAVGDYWVIDFF